MRIDYGEPKFGLTRQGERERDGEADIADAARISDTKRNFKPMLNGRQDR